MATLTFEQARACVLSQVLEAGPAVGLEEVPILQSHGRVLAQPVLADRDFPVRAKSMRDGFAVRSADLPGTLLLAGEVRAGASFTGHLHPGQAIEIMTGANLPDGANAVVMVEHTSGAGGFVSSGRSVRQGENVNRQASEARGGEIVLSPGVRLGFAEIAMLAAVGQDGVQVFKRPRVAILATGDEIVGIDETPLPHQIRNSNSYSLAAQVWKSGGCPEILPVARDEYRSTRDSIEAGLGCELLLLSGGVSAGKYDLVEKVLADLGVQFYFDRVLIQPGQPVVFGAIMGKFLFGLPGNPGSTMVTFEIFAKAVVEILGGQRDSMLPLLWTRLEADFKQKSGLTRFLPARLKSDGSKVMPLGWQGSSDVTALARSNAFLVTEPERETWAAGDWIRVLMR